MRKLAPFLLVAAVLSFAPFVPPPVGPEDASAAGKPAWLDGGCMVSFVDAGSLVAIDTYRSSAWQASFLCTTQVRYVFCESSPSLATPDCAASAVLHERLRPDITYDIAVPANQRYLSIVAEDGGGGASNGCCVNIVQPRFLPE